MKNFSLYAMGISLSVLAGCQQKPSHKPFAEPTSLEFTNGEARMIATGNDFACNFFQKTNELKKQGKNLFISPLSAQFNLRMVANGASGKTLQEIESVFPVSGNDPQSANTYFLKLMDNLPRLDTTVTIQTANSIWIDKDSPVKTSFKQVNRKYFFAEIQNLDFSNPKSAEIINQWTEKQTQGRITRVLDRTQGNCILINTLFFRGEWTNPFNTTETRQEDFYTSDGSKIPVNMIHQYGTWFGFHETELFEMATLPYGNKSYAMTVILPKRSISADSCITTFTGTNWKSWLAASDTTYRNLDLKLPSIKLDFNTDLIPVLENMGVKDAFNENCAEFSYMTDMSAYISRIMQFTRLEITEEGTVAAAATITNVTLESETIPEIASYPFHVNRPFLLVIHESKTGLILFMGKVTDIP